MINRIVSLLPGATELLYELGVQERLYGVTHECRFPPEAASKPQVISSMIDAGMGSAEIDAATRRLLDGGEEIFALDERRLAEARPDLIIAQDTCGVCAADADLVGRAVQMLEKRPAIHLMDPHGLDEIIDSVTELGRILGAESKAAEIAGSLRRRIDRVKGHGSGRRPRVLAVEWMEPFFTAGHWIPEMVEAAGGANLISRPGERSRVMDIGEISDASPDVIVMMPCGFDAKRTVSEYGRILGHDAEWNELGAARNGRVYAVDADSFFSKPGIRTVDGLEILARIIQPGRFEDLAVPDGSFLRIE